MAGNLTRILNNQIYSKTIIASQKIADGTITGSLFSSNVTVPGDFLITGNLFVLGSSAYTTIASTNTYVNDPLITLNNGFAGSNTYDEGLVFNRGSSQNRAFIWSEFNKEFRLIGTTETGTTYGNVAVSNYANLHIGNLTVDYTITHTGNFFTNGFINTTANISAAVGVFGAINSTGLINTTGNVSASQVSVATLNATGLINTLGNISASEGSFATIKATGYINTLGNISTAQLNAGQINTTGNVLATAGVFNALTVNGTGLFTTLTATGNIIAGLAQFAAINSTPIGNATPSTGTFTVLAANNNLWANASIATTTQGTGAIVVPNGGISVAGAANIGTTLTVAGATQLNSTLGVGGVTSFTNTTNATEPSGSSGALQIKGGVSIAQDVWVGGNLYAANIIGVTANVITVQDPLLYLRPNTVTPYNYDIGFYSAFQATGLGTINQYQHTGVFRDPLDNTWKFASNLAEPSASYITLDGTTVYDPIKAGNLQLTVTTDSTSATTGALIVAGGAGIGGNIFHTGTQLQTSASSFVMYSTPTTANNFSSATTIFYGAPTGDFTIRNPNINTVQVGTLNLFNGNATTINFGQTANITMGTPTGVTTLQGNANVRSITQSTSFTTGALVVAGGVGVASNLNIKGGSYLTLGKDLASGIVYPEDVVQVTTSANSVSRISLQNLSAGQNARSEFAAYADNGSNVSNFFISGVTSSGFNSIVNGAILNPNDGYAYASNNLALYAGTDVVLATNSGSTGIGVRLSSSNSNVGVQYSTASSSHTTGAFTVVGGVGIGGEVYTGKGLVVNNTNSTSPFRVKSSTSGNVAIFANVATGFAAATETVIIGGGNTTIQPGATLKVNSVTAMMIPAGPTAGRPSNLLGGASYDVQGMIRFNTTSNALEYYDGAQWAVAGSTFTVISDRQFSGNIAGGYGNVDGTNTTFTLQSSATTSATIVSINGVMQFPTLAYSVSGTTLTFTEPPAPDDVIDVRVLTTTATVSSVASGNGLMQFVADDSAGASIWTGTNATTKRLEINPVGDIGIKTGSKLTYDQTVINIAANATPYVIATFSQSTYTSAKYQIQATKDATNFQSMEALVLTDKAGNAYVTTYAVVTNGTEMGTLSANVLAGNVNVYFTSVTNMTNANVKAFGTYII